MIWIIEYQPTKGAAWISLDAECPSSDSAWGHFSFIRISTGLDYYAACVRPRDSQ